jgi:hypothetical protein
MGLRQRKEFKKVRDIEGGRTVNIDGWLVKHEGAVESFGINVCLVEGERKEEIYRIDTSHGYAHEHMFWRDRRPIAIESDDFGTLLAQKIDYILNNFEKWARYFRN